MVGSTQHLTKLSVIPMNFCLFAYSDSSCETSKQFLVDFVSPKLKMHHKAFGGRAPERAGEAHSASPTSSWISMVGPLYRGTGKRKGVRKDKGK